MRTPLIEWMEQILGPSRRGGSENVLFRCPFHSPIGCRHKGWSFTMHIYTGLCNCKSCGEGWTLKSLLRKLGVDSTVYDTLVESGIVTELPKMERLALFSPTNILPEEILYLFPRFEGKLPGDEDDPTYVPFSASTFEEFDVRWDQRLSRVVYPLRDSQGRLRALHYRASCGDARYRYYTKEELAELGIECEPGGKRNCFLHGDRVFPKVWASEVDYIILTEGPKQAMRVFEAGFPWVVATLGDMGGEQLAELSGYDARIILLTDNDEPGRNIAQRYRDKLFMMGLRPVIVDYGPVKVQQPDQMSTEALKQLLEPLTQGGGLCT